MFSRIKSLFTRKNRKTPTQDTRGSREKNKTRSILKRTGSTSNKTKKNIRFSSPSRNQVKLYAPENEPREPLPPYRKCSSRPREEDFPCIIRGTVFYDMDEYEEYENLIHNKNRGHLPVRMHYAHMKKTLKNTGSYKKKIPPQYRYYDEETGKIHDIRLFPDEDE
jgi:hypothetical protein